MSMVEELYNKMIETFHVNPKLEQDLYTEISRIVSSAYSQAMASDEGYCFKFSLPIISVGKLYNHLGFNASDVYSAFEKEWGSDAMKNHMYADPYYQLLCLLLYYGAKQNKKHFIENSMLIILLKIWNGRRTRYLKHCDKRIMKYVVSNMTTNRHLFAKYDNPLSLLKDYFMPTLLKTYQDRIKNNPKELQRLISQSWGRVRQLFITNLRTDIATGEKVPQGGILAMYMKAKQEGLALSAPRITSDFDEEAPSFSEYSTTSNRDEIINTTSDFITMNPNPKYQPDLIIQLNKETKVSAKIIERILESLHNHLFHDYISDIISIILSRTNISVKNDICLTGFAASVKKNVISSKNNADARKLQTLCNMLLMKIFETILNLDFNKYSNVQQIQLRTVIIQGIIYNLKKNICRGQIN